MNGVIFVCESVHVYMCVCVCMCVFMKGVEYLSGTAAVY